VAAGSALTAGFSDRGIEKLHVRAEQISATSEEERDTRAMARIRFKMVGDCL